MISAHRLVFGALQAGCTGSGPEAMMPSPQPFCRPLSPRRLMRIRRNRATLRSTKRRPVYRRFVARPSPRRPGFIGSHRFPTALSRLISRTPSCRNDRASRCGALVFDHSPGRFVTRRRHPAGRERPEIEGGQLSAGSLSGSREWPRHSLESGPCRRSTLLRFGDDRDCGIAGIPTRLPVGVLPVVTSAHAGRVRRHGASRCSRLLLCPHSGTASLPTRPRRSPLRGLSPLLSRLPPPAAGPPRKRSSRRGS
jgi:hypothetical protein